MTTNQRIAKKASPTHNRPDKELRELREQRPRARADPDRGVSAAERPTQLPPASNQAAHAVATILLRLADLKSAALRHSPPTKTRTDSLGETRVNRKIFKIKISKTIHRQ